jgi:hypothetical protein
MAFTWRFGKKPRNIDPIAYADRLVKSGKFLQAIDTLTQANSANPSPAIEAQLIELRHEALFHLSPKSSFRAWPPATTNLFSDVVGIPEINRSELNVEKLRSAIFNKGSLIVRQLITPSEAQAAIDDVNSSFEKYDDAIVGKPLEESAPWFVPFKSSERLGDTEFSAWSPEDRGSRHWVRDGGGVLAADSPRTFSHLIQAYLGERPALSVKKTTLRRVAHDGDAANGWHQDGAFLGEGIRTINLWIALTDCGVDAPTMDMVPKRLHEIAPTGTHGAAFDWSVSREIVDECSADLPPVRLQFKAGDAILFDEMNLHCTAIAPGMTKDRYAIEAWFFAPSCYPMNQLPLMV